MSGMRAGRVVKLKSSRRTRSRPVLRMMAIMQDGSNNEELPKEFVEGGRTGRRNAMPDILHPPDTHATTADLPSRLQQLATTASLGNSPESVSERKSGNLDTNNNYETLMKFLTSEQACRCTAMPGTSGIGRRDAASVVESTDLLTCLQDEEYLLKSVDKVEKDIFGVRDAMMMTFAGTSFGKDKEAVVSVESVEQCSSDERLARFLSSDCSKRRNAIPNVSVPVATSVSSTVLNCQDSSDTLESTPSKPLPGSGFKSAVSRQLCEIILKDDQIFPDTLSDPNNPQPGPSSQPPGCDNTDEAQKKDSGS